MTTHPNWHVLRSMSDVMSLEQAARVMQSGHDIGVRAAIRQIEKYAPERTDLLVAMRGMLEGGK